MTEPTSTHMPYCQGDHDRDGDCLIQVQWSEMGTITLAGQPCSHVGLEIEPSVLTEPGHIDQLMAALQQVRPALDASQAYVDCDLHDHTEPVDDDEGDEDDGGLTCVGCNRQVDNTWRVSWEEPHPLYAGQTAVVTGNRCFDCCAAMGIQVDPSVG